MEQAIFGQAVREYTRLRRLLPWLLLGFGCLGLASVWHNLARDASSLDAYLSVSSMLVFRLTALASAIFTTAIISQEVEQRTIVYLLTRPVPRWKLIVIRYLASILVVSALAGLSALLTSLGAFRGLGTNELLFGDIKALVMGAFAYGALFLFVSLVINRAMIVCLLFAFGWETMVPNMPGTMDRLSVLTYMQAIAEHPAGKTNKAVGFFSGTLGANSVEPDKAWAILIGMSVILVALSAWWFTHFEYVPREDAE